MKQFFRRSFAAHLVDPVRRVELVDVEEGVAPVDQPERIYPIRDGILNMMGEAGEQRSEAYDRACGSAGFVPPDEHTFRLLPRESLPGWGERYWIQRAYSTATLWHFLEERRRQRGQPPVDVQGVAAEVTNGLPYTAYALDVGGYVTVAVSPHAGEFGLAAYPYTRYYRVQADWDQLPLRPKTYDLIVLTGSLSEVSTNAVTRTLQVAHEALRRGGDLIITDTPDQSSVLAELEQLGMAANQRPINYDDADSMVDRMKSLFKTKPDVPPLVIAHKK